MFALEEKLMLRTPSTINKAGTSWSHWVSPIPGYQPTKEQLHFKELDQGDLLTSVDPTTPQLAEKPHCVSWTMATGQNTHIPLFTTTG